MTADRLPEPQHRAARKCANASLSASWDRDLLVVQNRPILCGLPEHALARGQTSIRAGFRRRGRNIGGRQICGPHRERQLASRSLLRDNGTMLAIRRSCKVSVLWAPDSVPS